MESFSISCTTCQVQLKVRDRSAVGQILTCPKCGSMVLVEPPAGDLEGTSYDASRIPPTDPQLETNPAEVEQPPSPAVAPAPWLEAPVQEEPTPAPVDSSESDVGSSETALAPHDSADMGPLLPNDDWTPSQSQQWRGWLLTGGAAVVGLVLAVALFAWFSNRIGATKRSAGLATSAPQPVPADESVSPTPAGGRDDVETVEESPPPGEEIAFTDDAPEATPPVAPQDVPPPGPEPPIKESADVGAPEDVAGDPLPATTPTVVPTPPGLIPSDAERMAADQLAGAGGLAKTLRELESAYIEPPRSPSPDVSPSMPSESETVEAALKLPRPPPIRVDLDARLADQIPGIEFTEIPLLDFLRDMAAYSTIPVSIHPASLSWSRLSPRTPVSVRLRDVSVAEVLEHVLAPLQMYARAEAQGLSVRRRPTNPETGRRAVDLDVQDLADEHTSVDWIVETVGHLVAPDSWIDSGGTGVLSPEATALRVEQDEEVLFQVLFLLERMRVARGLPTQSRFPTTDFDLTYRWQLASEALSQHVSLNYLDPYRFLSIVQRLEEVTGVTLLIDWPSLAEAGWNAHAEVPFSVADVPLSEALVALLEPMELTYRVCAERLVQITSPEAVERSGELEFHYAGDLVSSSPIEALQMRLQSSLGAEGFHRVGAGLAMRYDAPSQYLIVRASQPAQRQIASLLKQWREEMAMSAVR